MENYMDIQKARHSLVVKSNDLIQKSRFDLGVSQQRIVLYLISQIKPEDDDVKLYEFTIKEFCSVCGISGDSGGNYTKLKAAIKEIADRSIWVTLPNGKETLLRWIEKPYIDENSGTIRIRLDKDMKPYLLQLRENFTRYELFWTLRFKRKYSIRLYELITSIHYDKSQEYERTYELDAFRTLLGAENYSEWADFKKRALEPAIADINEYSDKRVSYETITYGKTVGKIRLFISSKNGGDTVLTSFKNESALNGSHLFDKE